MRTAKGSIIMSVKDVDIYGEPEQVNESLKLLLSKFSKKESESYQILQGQVRKTSEILNLLEHSVNQMKEALQTASSALKHAQRKLDDYSQFSLL